MFLIGPGLCHRPSLSFSLAAFFQKYLLRPSLFPAVLGSKIHWIGNSSRLAAHSCAADDLELSLGNDQIELFDNYLAPAKQPEFNFPVDLDQLAPWGFDFPVLDLSLTASVSSSYQTSVLSFPEELDPPKSHFALNMIGLHQPPQAFQDFRRSPIADSPVTGSSELLVLFMDELFIKNSPMPTNFSAGYIELPPMAPVPAARKRRNSDFSEVDVKKIKVEPEQYEDRKEARHVCSECNASFKVKSYLTRHARKHTNAMAFVCPFHDISTQDSFGNVIKLAAKCHPTGGFSRRDTYKTHLKALHFIYPPGTKSSARNSTGGRCAGCFEYFESNTRWLKYHIECDQCKGLQEHSRSAKGNGFKNHRLSNALGVVKTESYD